MIMDKDNGVMFSFERLDAYIEARKLVKEIYLLLHAFPKIETYALSDQIRRSAISITSNIAEGSVRSSIKKRYISWKYHTLQCLRATANCR